MKVQPKRRKIDLDIDPESPELPDNHISETMEESTEKCEGFDHSKSALHNLELTSKAVSQHKMNEKCDVISKVASQCKIIEKNSNFDSSALLSAIECLQEKFDSDDEVMIKHTFEVVVDVHYTQDGIQVNPFSLDKTIKKMSSLKDDDEPSPPEKSQ
ncbi:uncharacterized protein LOC106655192 [Trichogramma pretiosum]|uniref:uncharacterized protein LOC106655192 n=1 Tax=Trichogramma pretiosum TaxID=7493 RepID=UPI0006C9DFFC|nr:uncharacterized protein LOC106655192 [Trichogramma pretiosum]